MSHNASYLASIIRKYRQALVCFVLVAATLSVYHGVGDFDFIDLDDNIYIYENPHVQAGLSAESLLWAFSNNTAGLWIPLTWLSFLVDISWQGVSPGWMHAVNLFFHLLNVILLFALLNRMTHAFWQSAFVAACLALHPLHVESVAWITERKDVLSTCLFLVTLWQYFRYAQCPSAGRYLATLTFYMFSLMAKPMYITLPFLLLLIDYWPLQRYSDAVLRQSGITFRGGVVKYLVVEKLPFFFLTAIIAVVTYLTFQKSVAWMNPREIPLDIRLTNVSTAYLKYIGKLVWPVNLSVFYPYRFISAWPQTVLAVSVLAAISWEALRRLRKNPFLFVGWFWFLGLLVPVIGLVNAGSHAMADRFAYGAFIGLYIAVAWGAPRVLSGWQASRPFLTTLGLLLIVAMMAISGKQVQYWGSSETLFAQSIKNTRDNWFLHNSLGNVLSRQGNTVAAITQYRTALRIKPDYATAHNNLGVALGNIGQIDAAIASFREALGEHPDYGDAHYNLGVALSAEGQFEEALAHYLEAIRIMPENARAHSNAGVIFARIGHIQEAREHFGKTLRINPQDENARRNLEVIERKSARTPQ